MPNRLFVVMLVLLGALTANAHKRARVRVSLVLNDGAALSKGAKFASRTIVAFAAPPQAKSIKTFVDFHSSRVENDLMLFQPTLVGIPPVGRARNAETFSRPRTKPRKWFLANAKAADELALRRDRDRLLLFRGPQAQGGAIGIGLAMFAAATMLSAHAPPPFRILFDGPVHLGPAIFDGGGMGAGIAGRGF